MRESSVSPHAGNRSLFTIIGLTIVIGIIYGIIVVRVLPANAFSVNYHGAKLLQITNFVEHGRTFLGIDYPGEAIDVSRQYAPFVDRAGYYSANDTFYAIHSFIFVAAASLFYPLLGYPGLYVVPILGTLGIIYLTWRLTPYVMLNYHWLPPLLVGLVSPFIFFTVDLWEHSLAVFFILLAVLLLIDADYYARGVFRLFLAGVCIGVAIWGSTENYVMIVAVLLALLWTRRLPKWRAIGMFLLGTALMFGVLWFVHSSLSGLSIGPYWGRASLTPPGINETRLMGALVWLLPYTNSRWMLSLIVIIGLRVVYQFAPQRLKTPLILLLALSTAGLIGFNVVYDFLRPWEALSIVRAFPLIFFLVFAGVLPSTVAQSDSRDQSIRLLIIIALVYGIGIVVYSPGTGGPSQWGPRWLLLWYPILALILVSILQKLISLQGITKRLPELAVLGTFIVLLGCSLLVQVDSIRSQRNTKTGYARLVTAVHESEPEVVITDVWWLPQMTAAAFGDKTFFLANAEGNGSMNDLLNQLIERDITSFVYITADDPAVQKDALPDFSQWNEVSHRVENIWLPVDFFTYQLQADNN